MITIAIPKIDQTNSVRADYGSSTNGAPWVYGSSTSNLTMRKHGAWTRYRDKDRFAFYRTNGYLPVYPLLKETVLHTATPKFQSIWYHTSYKRWHNVTYSMATLTENCMPATYGTNTTITQTADALANTARARVNEDVRNQHYSVFETCYEGKKTSKMINKAVTDTWQALRALKRGRFAQAARILGLAKPPPGVSRKRSLTDNWLEYRYGWGPTYQTVYGEMKRQYDRVKLNASVGHVLSAHGKVEKSIPSLLERFSIANIHAAYPSTFTIHDTLRVRTKEGCSIVARCDVLYRVTNPGLASTTSLGLTNPALLAWEALPLTFVCDWFVNVSDVLAQLDAWSGKTFLAGTESIKVTSFSRHYIELQTASPYSTNKSHVTLNPGYTERTYFNRKVLTAAPVVNVQFGVNLNMNRILDGISLLRQMTR